MKTQGILLSILLVLIGCQPYVELQYADFMNKTHEEIANSLADILEVSPIAFNRITTIGSKTGYEYTTSEKFIWGDYMSTITVWIEENQPCLLTYCYDRHGTTHSDWLYDSKELASDAKSLVS